MSISREGHRVVGTTRGFIRATCISFTQRERIPATLISTTVDSGGGRRLSPLEGKLAMTVLRQPEGTERKSENWRTPPQLEPNPEE